MRTETMCANKLIAVENAVTALNKALGDQDMSYVVEVVDEAMKDQDLEDFQESVLGIMMERLAQAKMSFAFEPLLNVIREDDER